MILKRLAKDTLIYGSGEFLSRLITLISLPIFAHRLTTADFGLLDLILTGGTLLGYFVGCGLNNATQRYYWDSGTTDNDRPIIVSNGLFLQFAIGILMACLIIAISPLILSFTHDPDLKNLTYLTLIGAAIMIPSQQWIQYSRDILRLHFAQWRFLFLSFTSKIFTVGLSLYAVFILHKGIEGFILAQAIGFILLLPIAIYMIKKDIHFKLSYKWIQDLVRFGSPFIYVGIAYWVFGYIDRWMLASLSSIEETGLYSMASRLASVSMLASIAFGQAWSPHAIKIKTDNPDTYKQSYATILIVLTGCMIVISGTLAIFAPEIIYFILPTEYAGAALPMSILCFSIIFQATQQVTAIGISLEKKTHIFSYLAWITAIINIGLNFLFIPSLGAIGAALATAISQLILTLVYGHFTQKFHCLPIKIHHVAYLTFSIIIFALCVYYLNDVGFHLVPIVLKLALIILVSVIIVSIFLKEIVNAIKK